VTALDTFDLDRLATAAMRARLSTLGSADLDLPTPCDGWAIRNMLAHLVGGNIRFGQALRGEAADFGTRDDEVVTSPLGEFDATAATMAATVAGLDDPKRTVRLAAAECPAYFAIGVHGADMLVHGWDLAVATGQDRTLDPELCRAALAIIGRYPPSFWGPDRFFADQVATDSADPQVRLLALTGRDPDRARAA